MGTLYVDDLNRVYRLTNCVGNGNDTSCYAATKETKKICLPNFDPSRKGFLQVTGLTLWHVTGIFVGYCIINFILQVCQIMRADRLDYANVFLIISALVYFIFLMVIQDRNIFSKDKFCIMNPYDAICDDIPMTPVL